MKEIIYKTMQAKALEQLHMGQSLTGKDGVFGPLLKENALKRRWKATWTKKNG